MMNKKVEQFFAAQAKREAEAKKAELQALIDTFGIDDVLATMISHLKDINKAVADVEEEEEKETVVDEQFEEAKHVISTKRYLQSYDMINGKQVKRPVEFSEKTNKLFYKAIKDAKVGVWEKGSGKPKYGKITNPAFAKFIIEASGNNPQTLIDIINIIKETAWDGSYGITREKMELVYHTLILHQEYREEVIDAITELFKKYDKTSMKVDANKPDKYRNHLNYTEKMMMFIEDYVCDKINATPLFEREITIA